MLQQNRALLDDECSDAETELFSFVAHSKCVDTDLGYKRERRFFFKFVEEVMSAIRRLESNQLNNPDSNTTGGKRNKNKNNLPSTLNFSTNAQGQACIMNMCGMEHRNSKGKASKSLHFCDNFSKNLKLAEHNRVIKAAKFVLGV